MKKTKSQTSLRQRVALLALGGVFVASFLCTPLALADQFDAQINQLHADSNQKEQVQGQLLNEAASLNEKIQGLQTAIGILEDQITKDQAKADALKLQIAQAEVELAKQKDLLGKNIKAMYLEGEISTLEMLASSKDLSEFVDKEQYRNSVKDKIRATLDQINALKLQLKSQKEILEQTIADSQSRQAKLDAQKAEQDQLLHLNEAQRANIESQIKSNNEKISKLRSEQAAANALLFGNGIRNVPDTTGYPWANAPFPNEIPDPWGMYLRQCVSYTAWKVYKSGRTMPYWGGRGNANQWDDNARAEGIPVDGNPRQGDIAVSNSGFYGHVMYVEHVYGDGRILVSQYNAGWDGRYSEAIINVGALVFIHFR